MSKDQFIYAEAANGLSVRIPADKYDSWKAAQDELRAGTAEADSETLKQLHSIMEPHTDSDRSSTKTPRTRRGILTQEDYDEDMDMAIATLERAAKAYQAKQAEQARQQGKK